MEKSNESIEDEELFDEDLEEVLEDVEDSETFENEEEDSDEEITIDEKNYRASRLNEILANPWKKVSLEEMNFSPKVSLESNFKEDNFEEFKKNEPLDYLKSFDGEDKKQYTSVKIQENFNNNSMSKEEKNLEEQKRLYSSAQSLHHNLGKRDEEKEMITPEDIIKKDYFSKKKFF
jgi:hypothetical protein